MSVIKVTTDNFAEVIATEKPGLLDFYADWCGPCRMVGPIVAEIAEEHPEILVGKVNVDENPDLARKFNVTSIPLLVVLKNGELVNSALGLRPKEEILALI